MLTSHKARDYFCKALILVLPRARRAAHIGRQRPRVASVTVVTSDGEMEMVLGGGGGGGLGRRPSFANSRVPKTRTRKSAVNKANGP